MDKLLSGTTAIPSILTLVVLAVMLAFQGHCVLAYAVGFGAVIWFVLFLIYQRQAVNVDILSCECSPKSDDEFTVTFQGFISSRRPDGLKDIRLWLLPSYGLSPTGTIQSSSRPISSKPQWFKVSYNITYEFSKQALREQQINSIAMVCLLSADMRKADWLFVGGTINPDFAKGGTKIGTMEKTAINAQKRKKGFGISKKQFHDLLKKSSQRIKKSDSKKS